MLYQEIKDMSQSIGNPRDINDRYYILVFLGTSFSLRERMDLGLYHAFFWSFILTDPEICQTTIRSLFESVYRCISLHSINKPVVIQVGYS